MKVGDVFRHPIDTFRASPFSSLGNVVCAGGIAGNAALHEANTNTAPLTIGGMAVASLGIAVCTFGLMREQLNLKERLEDMIEQQGYRDRIMEPTTQTWCDRQVGRVVAKNEDKMEDYLALCSARKEVSRLTWLPNV